MYPYEYVNSFKKFFNDKLPDRCEFFSSLKNEYINEKDYSHAINVWNVFKMNTMGNYHDLYHDTFHSGRCKFIKEDFSGGEN